MKCGQLRIPNWLIRRKGELAPASFAAYSGRTKLFLEWLGAGAGISEEVKERMRAILKAKEESGTAPTYEDILQRELKRGTSRRPDIFAAGAAFYNPFHAPAPASPPCPATGVWQLRTELELVEGAGC